MGTDIVIYGASFFKVYPWQITHKYIGSRKENIIKIRQMLTKYLVDMGHSYPEIASKLDRDRVTVMNAYLRAIDFYQYYEPYKTEYNKLANYLDEKRGISMYYNSIAEFDLRKGKIIIAKTLVQSLKKYCNSNINMSCIDMIKDHFNERFIHEYKIYEKLLAENIGWKDHHKEYIEKKINQYRKDIIEKLINELEKERGFKLTLNKIKEIRKIIDEKASHKKMQGNK